MRDRWVAIDAVRAAPEEQIARLERVELERILVAAQNRIEISRLADPNILLAGIARHFGESAFAEHVEDEAGTIHAAICGLGGAIRVAEISLRQLKPGLDDSTHFGE